jgi:DNA-binding CsgD family transcriptional regulator
MRIRRRGLLLSSASVAVALEISVKTAETHRANIMRKLDVHSISDVVRYAIRNKIIRSVADPPHRPSCTIHRL